MENKDAKITWREAMKLTWRTYKDIKHYVPQIFPAVITTAIVSALTPYITIWLSAQLINEIAGLRREEVLWKWVFLTIGVTVCTNLMVGLANRWKGAIWCVYYTQKGLMYTDKFLSMDYPAIDNQKNRDLYIRYTQKEGYNGMGTYRVVDGVEEIVRSVLGIAGAIALTVSLFTLPVPDTAGSFVVLNHPLMAVGLLVIMAVISYLGSACVRIFSEKENALAEEASFAERKFRACHNAVAETKRWLDIRTYNQQNMICSYMEDTPYSPGGLLDKHSKGRYSVLESVGIGSAAVFTGFVYVYTCLKALAGAFGIGSVTQYVGAITTLSQNVAQLLNSVTLMKSNGVYLRTLYEFMDIPNLMYKGSLTTETASDRQYEVEFRNVSFQYPGAETWALKNVSLKFKIGKKLAIVGENGSGKTTFIKLLCRLYDPQEGQILLNGIDIREYDYRDYMNVYSIVFQDFQLLSQSLGANVAGNSEYDEEKVRRALIDAGFEERLEQFPDGLNTHLYKEFGEDGVEVSGGEAQKIAIARALYKDASFIILDEPTAALDPIAEAEIYAKFNAISGDKTAIYISHRLSSCKFCDEIAVFHEGSVIEQGTHEDLLARENGKYHELWNAQAKYYEKTPQICGF